MPSTDTHPEATLDRINHELADVLHTDAMTLATGGGAAMEDPLWVWGVLGGKDVGKSTLINALAGAAIVQSGQDVGEGTFRPAAYLTESDAEALRHRFSRLSGVDVAFQATAPERMHRLVLLDLPDFDSVFAHHVEQVRRIAQVLDGIIWVTTPKKIGDLRAVEEIRRVLKAPVNFVYVVNKMDWLLAQSNKPPTAELERTVAALASQIAACDEVASSGAADRSFMITALHRSSDDLRTAIARSRAAEPGDQPSNGALAGAVDRLLDEFDRLRQILTAAPTAEAGLASKRANLTFQLARQVEQIRDHHRPHQVRQRLERAVDDAAVEELTERYLSPAYCREVMSRLNSERRLFAEWSTQLFRRRVANWPLVGLIAWPLVLLGGALGGVRRLWGSAAAIERDDPFRIHGISLGERMEGLVTGVRARLAGMARQLDVQIPNAEALESQFRADAAGLAEELRSSVIVPLLNRRPSAIGRLGRAVIPLAALLWFPLIQPVLESLLPMFSSGESWSWRNALALVRALSAGHVLTGLVASLLILAGITAAVYSCAVRDTHAAVRRMHGAADDSLSQPMSASAINAVREPVIKLTTRLSELCAQLDALRNGHGAAG